MLRSLRLDWFDQWNGELQDALDALPERECMPRELYRSLLSQQDDRIRIALVSNHAGPVMLAGVRHRDRYVCEAIGNWQAPGPVFAVRPEHMSAALARLPIQLGLGWWRMPVPPPTGFAVRSVDTSPTHRMPFSRNPEEYWRETDYLRTIRNMRNRCKKFSVAIDHEGVEEWVIANWSRQWNCDGDPVARAAVRDRINVARGLQKHGRHVSISLFDNGKLIGGSSNFIHNGDLVAGVYYYEPEYRNSGVGVRLIDLAFELGAERGLAGFDLGGKADYKQKWAPIAGTRSSVLMAPPISYHARRAAKVARGTLGRATSALSLAQTWATRTLVLASLDDVAGMATTHFV